MAFIVFLFATSICLSYLGGFHIIADIETAAHHIDLTNGGCICLNVIESYDVAFEPNDRSNCEQFPLNYLSN